MGEFLLRRCDSPGGVSTGEERMLPAVVSYSATGAGFKRSIPHGAEQAAAAAVTGPGEQGFRISNQRTKTFVNVSPASSSSGGVAPAEPVTIDRAALSPHRTITKSPSSAAVAGDGGDTGVDTVMLVGVIAKHEHLLQGMAVTAQGEEQEEKGRLCQSLRRRFGITVTGEYSHGGGNSTPSSSTDSDNQEVAESAAELESTASNAAQGSRSTPPAARRGPVAREVAVVARPPQDEIEAFFAKAEAYLAKNFADKYNYDIVKDAPLEGRYEWTSSQSMP